MTPLKRILLVEDSPRDAELVLNALTGHQLVNEITHVRDGADALDYLHRRGQFADRRDDQPALIRLDLKLPKVDGLEVLRRIKTDPRTRMLPIVILTSSRRPYDQQMVAPHRVTFVTKPSQWDGYLGFGATLKSLLATVPPAQRAAASA